MHCPWCSWEGEPKGFDAHLKVCKNNPVKQSAAVSHAAVVEAVNPSEEISIVVREQIDSIGNICFPLAKSPAKEYASCIQVQGTSEPPCIAYVLMDLIVAERVAQRQYDELLQIPEIVQLKDKVYDEAILSYASIITAIRDDEHEHEKILTQIIAKMGYHVVAPSEPGRKTFRLQKI